MHCIWEPLPSDNVAIQAGVRDLQDRQFAFYHYLYPQTFIHNLVPN